MTRRHRRPYALAILVAAAALALAACTSGSSAPQVASLGTSTSPGTSISTSPGTGASPDPGSSTSDGSTPATQPGDVTSLLNEWAACERSNGDPNQADPTVDASGVIYITVPQGAQAAGDIHDLTGACTQYLAQAQNELRAANPVAPPPDQSEYLKYVNCMRTNGVPNYPYPDGDQTNFQGTGVDPNSPAVERVNQLCGKKIGAPTWWINGTNTPGDIEVSSAGMNPNATPPACFYQKVNPCSGERTKPASNGGSGANG